jgi:hypothetical protein
MHGPKPGTQMSDRILECQEDIERAFLAVVAEARVAGWTHLEACLALTELADNRVLGHTANEETNKQIRDLIGRYYKRRPGEP